MIKSRTSPCPFLTGEQYDRYTKLGWEYDKGTGGLHFFIHLGYSSGIAFDVFQEEDLTFVLYCGEFDGANMEGNQEFQPQSIDISRLEKIIEPYLTRGVEV